MYFFDEYFHVVSGTKEELCRQAEMSISLFFCDPVNLSFMLPDGRNTIHLMDRLGHLGDWMHSVQFRIPRSVLGRVHSAVMPFRKEQQWSLGLGTPCAGTHGVMRASSLLLLWTPP